jgi:HEPN domain-containing protein
MDRAEFQALADLRINEALGLLSLGMYDGAYYLAGYAVECALKSCIARRTRAEEFPPSPEVTREYYTHDLKKLLKHSGLQPDRDRDAAADPELDGHWGLVLAWSEQSRYERKDRAQAEGLIEAISDADHGVLPWIKARW